MNSNSIFAPLVMALCFVSAAESFAEGDGAQVIFTTSQLVVIDAAGVERTVKQGDFIHAGERIITPLGVSAQVRLPDGTLIGARPGSDIRLESIINARGRNVLVLNEGNVRVINSVTGRGSVPMPVDVINANSTLELKTGDGEAKRVTTGSLTTEPGSYNRLQTGIAAVRNELGTVTLAPMHTEASVAIPDATGKIDTRGSSRLSTLPVATESVAPTKSVQSAEILAPISVKTPIQTLSILPTPLAPATMTIVSPVLAPAVITGTTLSAPAITTATTTSLSTIKLLSPTTINILPTIK